MKLTPKKLEGWGYCMLKIAWPWPSTVFDWSTRVMDGQTDGQTVGQTQLPWHIRAIAYMLSRVMIPPPR